MEHNDQVQIQICPAGAENIVRAIVRRAKDDYLTWPPDNRLRLEAKQFIQSPFYEQWSGLRSEDTLIWLERRYREKYKRRLQDWSDEL